MGSIRVTRFAADLAFLPYLLCQISGSMKVISILLLGLLCAANVATADVLVYKVKITATVTGNGSTSTTPLSGAVVLDANTSAFAEIFANAKSKEFFVRVPTNITVATINGGLKSYTVIEQSANGNGGFEAKGQNATLNAGTANYSAPKTFQETGFDLNGSQLEEEKGTLTFDTKTTATQNGIDGNFSAVLSRLTQALIDAGYTQVSAP